MRNYSLLDQVLINVDEGMRSLFAAPMASDRDYPAEKQQEAAMSQSERRHAASLMRVNHSGEISAQALYQGQAATAQLKDVRDKMNQAALEEKDHLAWCAQRLEELESQPSSLNFVWYLGSFMIGALAGAVGDRWSLGFVVETERQVVEHLTEHLQRLPQQDEKSRAIVMQMRDDEDHHATIALQAGGAKLPWLVQTLMRANAKVMTSTTYYF
ncbi:MAG: 2-polyprenyl-3-methyl-6-methoxy-1,4-benzoquinone monooxygenase [Gammaproteobacteria bacterium]